MHLRHFVTIAREIHEIPGKDTTHDFPVEVTLEYIPQIRKSVVRN